MTDDIITRGRADLNAWETSKPDNFFRADANLQYVLRRRLGDGAYAALAADLTAFGAACATTIDQAAKQEDRLGNHPLLERFSATGNRSEQIEFHPNHDLTGQIIWRTGILAVLREPGHNVHQQALLYLLTQNGEAGHACSIACTAGLIRALQTVGDDTVKAKFLPPLLDPDYATKQHGAQFLTEVQGGSDVGANATVAVDQGDGAWRISGEKWFCSNIHAEQFLLTARPQNAVAGTRGLGLFLVPRRLDDGATNGFFVRRLKDKLGTRTLPSAEVDFLDAVAYPVGAIDHGFKNVVELVLNTSRLMNAISCAGIMRRAYLEAASFACVRQAFGEPIASYPLAQEAVADIQCETYAAVASGFALAALLDKIETGQATADDRAVHRMFVNLNKYITAVRGTEAVHRAIEVLGGNGTIETFSILPRLYRDMIVLESWEGTHNVLVLQVLRDIAKYRLHEALARLVRAQLESVTHHQLLGDAVVVSAALDNVLDRLAGLEQKNSLYQQAHARRLADLFTDVTQAALLLGEAQWELDQMLPTVKPEVVTHFVNRHLRPGYDPFNDDTYLPRLNKLLLTF